MSTHTGKLVADNGTYIINDTTAWTGVCQGVYVLSDTVFSVLGDANGNDKADYISAVGTAVKAGALISPKGAGTFTSVTLTSGQVALIL
jgi:hypothetical protein